jgi:hypothetical protein
MVPPPALELLAVPALWLPAVPASGCSPLAAAAPTLLGDRSATSAAAWALPLKCRAQPLHHPRLSSQQPIQLLAPLVPQPLCTANPMLMCSCQCNTCQLIQAIHGICLLATLVAGCSTCTVSRAVALM